MEFGGSKGDVETGTGGCSNEGRKCQNGGEVLMRTDGARRGSGGTGGARFQMEVSRRYHGSYCDSQINFNAPL